MAKADDPDAKITRITLCGVQGCCPTVEVHHKTAQVVIADDHGGKVTLSREEWEQARNQVTFND